MAFCFQKCASTAIGSRDFPAAEPHSSFVTARLKWSRLKRSGSKWKSSLIHSHNGDPVFQKSDHRRCLRKILKMNLLLLRACRNGACSKCRS